MTTQPEVAAAAGAQREVILGAGRLVLVAQLFLDHALYQIRVLFMAPHNNLRIIDNFMDEFDFDLLQSYIMGRRGHSVTNNKAYWMVSPVIQSFSYNGANPDNNTQLVHFLGDEEIQEYNFQKYIGYFYLSRCKANLTIRDSYQEPSSMHVDMNVLFPYEDDDIEFNHGDDHHLTDNGCHIPMKTAILYLNTCNGYTKFQTGEEVKSVANRFVEFDRSAMHCSVNPTDVPLRGVINFNYIPLRYFPRLGHIREEYEL